MPCLRLIEEGICLFVKEPYLNLVVKNLHKHSVSLNRGIWAWVEFDVALEKA